MTRLSASLTLLALRVTLLAVCLPSLLLAADDQPVAKGRDSSQDAAGVRYFETHIRPLLARHCYECHGPDLQESSLRLDTYAGLMAGGKSGPAIVAGKPTQSLLITAVKYQAPDLQMPPESRLSKQEIVHLERWITDGSPHPDADANHRPTTRTVDLEEARNFWAFRPPVAAAPPQVGNPDWVRNEVDHFILARLEQEGLTPAPPADRHTLLRRTAITLTGLPPTAAEVDAFLADRSPDAFARVVDRLLSSPHYGERWGRHWLDVARYADSNGLDENIHHGTAWRYRDYVVESLNADLPYDRFLTEQIAGDLLPADSEDQRYRQLIATAYLAIGPKVLAEVDETKMEMDIIDEQLDTLGRSVMGMTLGCVRCHDHKFDPFTQSDYYALAGIFKSTRTMEHYTKIARWWENPIPTAADKQQLQEHEQQLASTRRQIEELVERANQAVRASLPDGTPPPENLETSYPDETKTQLKSLRDQLAKLEKTPPEVRSVMGVGERTPTDLAVHIRGSHLTLGEVIPRRFPQVFTHTDRFPIDDQANGRLQLTRWLTDSEHPLTSRVIVNRVWRWHFGNGLVASPDNFGQLGERPVNQPLLDWLAVEFQKHDWSFKWLHRQILLSQTWQMSSDPSEPGQSIDPQNRLQWRANVRRLEAEAIRDAILAASGQLDRQFGGTLLTLKNRSFFFDHTSKDTTDYSSTRRSIYLPVVRNHLYEVFSLFDYSNAGSVVGDRTTSTVAPQALFMMNSEFILEASRHLAASIEAVAADRAVRVRQLYRRVLSRDPSPMELDEAVAFLSQLENSEDSDSGSDSGWRLLCQALLSSNEFIYLR